MRELYPRGVPQKEGAIQAGIAQNGMGPIAQQLTLREAEALAARVGDVVQTAVIVDSQALQELQSECAKAAQRETNPVSGCIQFSPKSGDMWASGVVVVTVQAGHDVVVLQSALTSAMDRVSFWCSSKGHTCEPLQVDEGHQTLWGQADLVRIREHLRRRQEEWAERHALLGGTGSGGFSTGAIGSSGGDAASGNRPDSAASVGVSSDVLRPPDPRRLEL